MLVNLGDFTFNCDSSNEWYTITSQIKSMLELIRDDDLKDYFDIQLKEHDRYNVIFWLYPFSSSLELLEKALRSMMNEIYYNFTSNDLDSLKIEAVETYNDSRWERIDEIITLYTFTFNGTKHFVELIGYK